MPSLAIPVSLFAALVFIIVSSPVTYKATNSVTSGFKLRLSDSAGNPNNVGLVVHALVFFLAMWGFARMNKV